MPDFPCCRLEELAIIAKQDDPANGRQFLYSPTQKGLDLLPSLLELARWSTKHDRRVDKTNPNLKRFRRDREKAIREVRERFGE
jgi:DNA-binding HxlR family transcriptional regulator